MQVSRCSIVMIRRIIGTVKRSVKKLMKGFKTEVKLLLCCILYTEMKMEND